MINLALFASGNGSNVENIHKYIVNRKLNNPDRMDSMRIKMVFTDNKNAYVINRCVRLGIPYFIFDVEGMNNGELLNKLIEEEINFIAFCGFLKLLPKEIVDYFDRKIVNIHPALLPKYGGQGMHGMNVHRKVIENKERYSGVSIHYVNDKYDEGDIILKIRQRINSNDTPEILSNKIHQLEYKWYPVVVYSIVVKNLKLNC